MSLFDLFRDPEDIVQESLEYLHQKGMEVQEHCAMIDAGWKFTPSNASEEEKEAAFQAFLHGGPVEWYPPHYVEEPIETSGKLSVEAEEPRRKLFGLF